MEETKLIIEALRGITGDAGELGKWWLILHYGSHAISSLSCFAFFGAAAYFGGKAILANMSADRCVREIARMLNIKAFDTWYGPDRERLFDAVSKLQKDSQVGAPKQP